jgi:F0F1-type ATP synthase membrane subunit b/b'
MPQVEDIKVLNIDNVPYAVDSMSDEVKQLVAVYNEWNQDLANAQKDFAQIRAAVQSLSNQIITQVRTEKAQEAEEAEKAAAEEAGEVTEAPAEESAPTLKAVEDVEPEIDRD